MDARIARKWEESDKAARQIMSDLRTEIEMQKSYNDTLRADLARVRKERDKLRECIGWINTWVLNDGRGYKDPETLLERILVYTNKVLESEE